MILIGKGDDLTARIAAGKRTENAEDAGRVYRRAHRGNADTLACGSDILAEGAPGQGEPNPDLSSQAQARDVERKAGESACSPPGLGGIGTLCLRISYLCAQDGGEQMGIGILLQDSLRGMEEKRRYVMLTALYVPLGLRIGPISPETLEEIEHLSLLSQAIRRGVSILGYGTNSAGALCRKLRQKGIDAATAKEAVAFLKERGYLREESDSRREAERCLGKQWGPKRIAAYLRTRGYDPEAIRQAIESLEDVNFTERCRDLTARHYPVPPADLKEKQKIIAFLVRQGYEMDDIRQALKMAWGI